MRRPAGIFISIRLWIEFPKVAFWLFRAARN